MIRGAFRRLRVLVITVPVSTITVMPSPITHSTITSVYEPESAITSVKEPESASELLAKEITQPLAKHHEDEHGRERQQIAERLTSLHCGWNRACRGNRAR